MSQFFNISRFGRLFSKHTTEHVGGYLLATGVLLGGLGLVLGFVAYMSTGPVTPDLQAAIFVMGLSTPLSLLIVICFLSSFQFVDPKKTPV